MAFGRKFRSAQARHKYRRRILVQSVLVLGVCVAFIVLLWQVSLIPALQIQTVEIDGNKVLTDEVIFSDLQDVLEEKYFGMFPHTNTFLLPKDTLRENILSTYPRVYSVYIKRKGFNHLLVSVKERKAVALWCNAEKDSKPESEREECYLVDRKAVIFAKAEAFVQNAFVTYTSNIESDQPIGMSVIPEDRFVKLRKLIDTLEDQAQMTVQSIQLFDKHSVLTTHQNLDILIAHEETYDAVLENILTILHAPEFKEEVTHLSDLEYIDLRFGNRVFYKPRISNEEEI